MPDPKFMEAARALVQDVLASGVDIDSDDDDLTEQLLFAVRDLENHEREWLLSKLRDTTYAAASRRGVARYMRSERQKVLDEINQSQR